MFRHLVDGLSVVSWPPHGVLATLAYFAMYLFAMGAGGFIAVMSAALGLNALDYYDCLIRRKLGCYIMFLVTMAVALTGVVLVIASAVGLYRGMLVLLD